MIGKLYQPPVFKQLVRVASQLPPSVPRPLAKQKPTVPLKSPALVQARSNPIASELARPKPASTAVPLFARQAQEGGWLHRNWKTSAAGPGASEVPSARLAQRLAVTFKGMGNPAATVKRQAPLPPQTLAFSKQPPPVPYKPEGLAATLRSTADVKRVVANAQPQAKAPPPPPPRMTPPVRSASVQEVKRPTPPVVRMHSAPVKSGSPPPAPPMGTLDLSPTGMGNPFPTPATSSRSSSVDSTGSSLLAELQKSSQVRALKQPSVEFDSVGTGSRALTGGGKPTSVDQRRFPEGLGDDLAKALAGRQKAAVTCKGMGRKETTPPPSPAGSPTGLSGKWNYDPTAGLQLKARQQAALDGAALMKGIAGFLAKKR